MGEQRFPRMASDSFGSEVGVIEWRGDHGTAHMHGDSDLKDPNFYSRYTLMDGITKLELMKDGLTLINDKSGEKFIIKN